MIDRIIAEIRSSVSRGDYLLALMGALSLPGICGKAEYPDLKQKKYYPQWYEEWIGQYETYAGSKMPYPTGKIVYELRNSLVHEGTPKIHENTHQLKKFKLIKSDTLISFKSSVVDESGDKELEVNVLSLIWKLCRCAEAYYNQNKDKFAFLKNIQIDF